jgi:type 1 glutamine amidotransferase
MMANPARCTAGRVDVALVCGGRWHDFDYARLQILQLLGRHDSVRCTVHPDFSDVAALRAADAVVAYTCDVRPGREQALALRDRVRAGGRLLALHATNSAIDAPVPGAERVFRTPDAMPEFSALLGNRFLAHPRISAMRIDIAQPEHPLASGIAAFVTTDEIYVSELADDLEVIMDASYDGPCPGFMTQQVPGRTRHPVLFSRPEGKGSVVSFTLGHCRGRFDVADQGIDDLGVTDTIAWDSPDFNEVLRRCVDWAVHGDDWVRCPAGHEHTKELP